ncbi:hypothetical protein PsYK624_002980 [Phanerochaete sordida]|uniref:Uncharacterized protein n=1 Tax=Phanerochaete sordida TaxID=48140 RepID=A0A9P3L816_9APHY|nr:hypothetical protein PsYK624_002980 [Phanerochaete sordida]
MRGATDLRNAKYEIEELRRESAFLKTQLETAKTEKEELTHRVKAVKETARQGLDAASKSLEETRTAMNSLKAQSEDTFAFFVQAKAVLPDVAELRETVSGSIKSLEEVIDEDGHLVEVTKTKEILTELKTQCANSGQVSEMLREKLQSVGSDLIDAKTRVAELEGAQNADRDALRLSSMHLSQANEQIQKFADALKAQQMELHEALLASADFEAQLASANERVIHLEDLVQRKDSELEALERLQTETRRLESLESERDIQVSELQALQERFDGLTKTSADHVAQIRSLETVVEAKDEAISQLESRIATKESQLQESHDTLQKLQHELGGVAARLQTVERDMVHKVEEIKSLEATLEASKSEVWEGKAELQRRSEQIHDLEAKYQVMEERYEIQLVTSKCAQDTQVDLQERLIAAEKTFTHDLEAATGRLKVEIAVLEQERAALQSTVQELEAAVHAHREELITIRADYDGRVKKQENNNRMHLELAEKRAGDLQSALDESRASVKSLEEQIASGKQEILAVRDELRDARLPDPAHKEALDALASQVTALRLENTELVLRARSIDARYRTGDLNEEEKTFINTLVQTSQSIHEQELVSKGNELRRRDNTIKEQQARIQVLEGSVAKHLKAISKPNAPPVTTAENRSLIDPAAWVPSSDKGKSPPQVSEEDVTSTNVDNTVTARPTPAPVRPVARPPLAAVPQPDPNTKARATRTPARLRPYAPAGAPTAKSSPAQPRKPASPAAQPALSSSPLVYPQPKTPAVRAPGGAARKGAGPKGTFRRLASALSDEIQDFDDAAPARRTDSPVGTPPGADRADKAERAQGSKAGLGKRDKPSDAGSPPGGRYAKRLRTSMRSRAAVQQDEPASKRVDTQQVKYKTKKRRV